MKKIFTLFLILILTFTTLAPTTLAIGYDPSATYNVQAQSAYIVKLDTNIIVYEKDSNLQFQAKSLTMLMNVALILSQYEDSLDSTMITMPSAISDYVYGTISADIRAGETVTLRQMLYAMLLHGGNDAAQGTAYVLSENDLTGWVAQMNSLSAEIGAVNSTWTDACGIDAGNVTTAVDMYLILRYLLEYDAFVEVMGTYTFEMPANTKHVNSYFLTNQNKMISQSQGGSFYREAVQGAKTDVSGYTGDNTGTQSCVSWSVLNGETYIYAVMGSPDSADTYGYATRRPAQFETTQLVDWVHSNFAIQAALDPDEPLCEVPVKYSADTENIKLYPDNQIMTILPSYSDDSVTQKIYTLPEYVAAPIKQGDIVGHVTLLLAGEEIGSANLIAGQNVERNTILYTYTQLQEFFGGFYVKTVLTLSAISLAIYFIWYAQHTIKNRRSKKIQRH